MVGSFVILQIVEHRILCALLLRGPRPWVNSFLHIKNRLSAILLSKAVTCGTWICRWQGQDKSLPPASVVTFSYPSWLGLVCFSLWHSMLPGLGISWIQLTYLVVATGS
jgi:hypothetical protein